MGLMKLCFDVSVVTPFEEIGLFVGGRSIIMSSILTPIVAVGTMNNLEVFVVNRKILRINSGSNRKTTYLR